ncbi:aluminum-activated malate transporter 9-like [Nicotiana tomentosiformis]|nr:aluminum-activated malate transporter 9-like [Nicotiana tomentosiformis]XP_033515468.1 aluminum-activated malate transporter 9-like [Nicotiana tomentosiformis]XP_033515469.1 aluminum-activated malate transporter 9-like [Nicotiana tomentosiformis]XP_033515470.1 aluminum-activated malate transporter 9-like [Nicotiana tomentosiformis]
MVTIKNFFKKASSDENKEKLLPNDYDERKGCCNCFSPLNDRFTSFFNNLQDFAKKAIEMGRNDPRKIIFSLKMGFALSFVSLLIFWKKPNDIAQFAIWAILTVLVMFEFSIGATLIKGFNRGLGTFCAGMLAFIFAQLALWAGERERVVIVVSIFIVAFFGSYLKLYPTMAPYEYGYRVFILTYCILIVAGNRTREYNVAICTRLALIALGAGICLLINISIYPIWSGEDLHRLVVKNFMDLANSLEGCINGYLSCVEYDKDANDSEYNGYKSVIESTGREQTLLGFAIWEPPHGRYRMHKNLWRDFVKLSSALRHCAFMVMALHGCIQSEIQAPLEKRKVFRNELKRVGANAAKVLRELGTKLEKLEMLDSHENILKEVHETAQHLQKKIDHKSYLLVNSKSWEIGKPNINSEDSSSENGSENLPLSSRSRSLSETAIDISSLQANWPQLAKESSEFTKSSFRKQNQWPSRLSLADGSDIADTCEMETYLSASSLSLATFASLLIEFVARLQNVVDNFEELSQRAEFKEPDVIIPPSAIKS